MSRYLIDLVYILTWEQEFGVKSLRAVAQTAFWKNLEPKTLALDVFNTDETCWHDSVDLIGQQAFHPVWNRSYYPREDSFCLIYHYRETFLRAFSIPEQDLNVLDSSQKQLWGRS